jgi:YD repeat-containing protein
MKKNLTLISLFISLFSVAQTIVPNFTTCLERSTKFLLDSSVMYGNSTFAQRVVYTYDAKERLISVFRKDVQLTETEKTTYNYDLNDSLIKKEYGALLSTPSLSNMIVWGRDASKRISSDTISYRTSAQYTPNTSTSFTYDVNGNILETTQDYYSGTWDPLNRRIFQRNSLGKATNILFQGIVNGNWENSSQTNLTYNVNNNVTDEIYQTWVAASSSWKNGFREQYTYTGNHLDMVTSYSWNNAWLNTIRYIYSPIGAIDSVTNESWNGTQWEGFKRYVRTWSQGKLTSLVEKGYTNQWGNAWKYEFVYDSNGNHTKTNFYSYNSTNNTWDLLIEITHYFRYSTVGLREDHKLETKIYPVPSSDMLYFETELPIRNGSVFSSAGIEVKQFDGSSVNLNNLPDGIYFVKLRLENGNTSIVKAVKK